MTRFFNFLASRLTGDIRLRYPANVPEKKGNWLGRLNTQKRTDRAMRFFYVRKPTSALYGWRWRGSLRACWFAFVYQSSNPVICRPPCLDAGRGLTAHKGGFMPGTLTPYQSHTIHYLAMRAKSLAILLAGKDIRSDENHQNILELCAGIANEVVNELAVLIGGAK